MGAITKRIEVSESGGYDSVVSVADVSVTTTKTQFGAGVCKKVIITNSPLSADVVRIGDTNITASRGIRLGIGETLEIAVNNVDLLFHRTETTTATINYVYMN